EKHDLATGEALGDIADLAVHSGQRLHRQTGRARLALGGFDDEVLGAPHRNENARRIGYPLAEPIRLAAAQPGPLEAGVGVVIGCSHAGETGTARRAAASRRFPPATLRLIPARPVQPT